MALKKDMVFTHNILFLIKLFIGRSNAIGHQMPSNGSIDVMLGFSLISNILLN